MRVGLLVGALLSAWALAASPAPVDGGPPPEADTLAKPRLAVLYFEAASSNPELATFAKGFAALLIADFATNERIVTVERERLEDVIGELKLQETGFADQRSFAKIGGLLGAEYLLVGTLPSFGKKVAIAARLVRVSDGRDVGAAKVIVDDDDVFAAEEKVVEKITAELKRVGLATERARKERAKVSASTFSKYARALDAKDKKDTRGARQLLSDVVKEAPDFRLAQLDLLSLTN